MVPGRSSRIKEESENSDQEGNQLMEATLEESTRSGKTAKKPTHAKKGAVEVEDCDTSTRKCIQGTEDINHDLAAMRSQHQSQSRRILDLQVQFEEARVRLDRLLGRSHRPRAFDDGVSTGAQTTNRRRIDESSDFSAGRSSKARHSDDDCDSGSSGGKYDDSGFSSSVSTDSSSSSSGVKRVEKKISQTSFMKMNIKAPIKPFEMVRLTVKVDDMK